MSWKEVDRLVSEQKFEAASDLVAKLRRRAQAEGNLETWTRGLIREVQLRTALHGYEKAVRFLRTEPWPGDARSDSLLSLFYAHGLVTYLHAYSWEIEGRERVESGEKIELESWTRDQIVEEAQRAYQRVWESRKEWGSDSIGSLAEFIEQNDYPARIRGTRRDAVTYLWVELLGDTSLWRPGQSRELYQLDLAALVEGDPESAHTVDLADPRVHPLIRMDALLADLEDWHRREGRPEAAFEARLERLRRLHESFARSEDRHLIRGDLERHLGLLGRQFEWWSMGRSLLAEMARDGDEPDNLIRAREIALEGERAHPGSVGAERCRHIVAAIEAAFYSLDSMTSDGPGRRSVRVTHKNLPALHFRAYALDLLAVVAGAQDFALLPSGREVEEILGRDSPAVEWLVDLPETSDFKPHRTYVTPPLERSGLYLLVASARGDFAERGNRRSAVHLVVGDLVLLTRPVEGGLEATVRSGAGGKRAAGVRVSLWQRDYRGGHRRLVSGVTGEEGRASFRLDLDERGSYFLLAERNGELALDSSNLRPWREREAKTRTAALVYTDRSIYRPGQEIHWKVVAYSGGGEEGRFSTQPSRQLSMELRDANGEVVEVREVTTNRFGSVSGTFGVPSGRLLGAWRLRASLGGGAAVRVEEYKRPTFEVAIREAEESLRLNRPARLGGEVRYYFGLPVVSGGVEWRVSREPIYPRWWGAWGWAPPRTAPEVVAAGSSNLDSEGRFEVEFTPTADEREAARGVTYRYRLSADVTDEGGETRTASRTFRLGFVAVEATIDPGVGFFTADEAVEIPILRRDLDGGPRPGEAAWRLLALEQPAETLLPADQPLAEPWEAESSNEGFRTPGDRLRPRWRTGYSPEAVMGLWTDGSEVASGALLHDQEGRATVELGGLAPGAYRLRYTTQDAFGTPYETSRELLVVDEGSASPALPALLRAERASVRVGESVRLLIASGLPAQEMVLEVFRAGRLRERLILDSAGGSQAIEIPVGPADRGGVSLALTALRDHQLMRLTAEVAVPWTDRRLELQFSSFRDRLRPGSLESWRVTVSGNDRKLLDEGAAEILTYMYDRSLDLFAAHHPFDPLSLYPRRTGAGPLWSSLGGRGEVWRRRDDLGSVPSYPRLRGDRLKFYDGYPIGGPGRRGAMMKRELAMAPGPPGAVVEEAQVVMERVEDEARREPADPSPPPAEAPPAEAGLRDDFAETAFWEPHLLTAGDGSVSFEFTVPDSLTEWSVWVHALTRDLAAGSLVKQARSVKELMVRPYLPRFLREGDRATLEVVVNNAGEHELSGALDLEILDPESGESLLDEFGLDPEAATGVPFVVDAGAGTGLAFALRSPNRVGTVAVRVVARAGDLSDGEQRPLPLLPGRMHLAQSRFVALEDAGKREMRFADLAAAGEDPSLIHEGLVVTLEAQLFYSVLGALPYLVSYPYECTEQTLNRFLSTGILTGLYAEYPAVARMAERLSAREERYETWSQADPNRKMALEETPWLFEARGGEQPPESLLNVLDPRIAAAERRAALAKLEMTQTSLGGFPWWPGGPPSPHMTLYLLNGFSRALEFGVEMPREMVERAWGYMHRHYQEDLVDRMIGEGCCRELVTFLNYVLSAYPDESWTGGLFTADDRRRMLDFSFLHWRKLPPLLKAYLALTLQRGGRFADARLVFDSVMDSSTTEPDLGTFWAPEDRAWLWYNDTVETHAFALRTLTELAPEDPRRSGLVHWLLLNKKLSHWKSTRATAEAIYALVHYLEKEGVLGVEEEARVRVGERHHEFVFEPDEYTGKRAQIVVPGEEVDPATDSAIVVEKDTRGLLFASATWHFSTERLPEESRGDLFSVTRRYFKRSRTGTEWVLEPIEEGARVEVGDQLEVHLSIRAGHAAEYVHLRDPRAAGFEPESATSRYRWDLGIGWYEEVRDSGANFFFDWLPAGEYTFKYRLRATMAGAFRAAPALLQSMYAPEFTAYSAGSRLEVAPGG